MSNPRIDVRDVKARADLVEVIRRAGVELERSTGSELVGLCPFHEEKTPSFTVTPSKGLFMCFGCGRGGDVLTFVQLTEGIDFKEALHRLASDWGLTPPTQARLPKLPEPTTEISRPPGVRDFWNRCRRVCGDSAVAGWLESRGVPPTVVEGMDLARVVPDHDLPPWIPSTWVGTGGYRLVLPVVNHTGTIVSVRLRSTTENASPKARAIVGFTQGSAVMADPLVSYLLAGDERARRAAIDQGIYVAEGEPDFLTLASLHPERGWDLRRRGDGHPGVIGLFKTAWCDAIAGRIPREARITVWPHRDDAGRQYAREVGGSLLRCGFPEHGIRCAELQEAGDVNDLLTRQEAGGWYLTPLPRQPSQTGVEVA